MNTALAPAWTIDLAPHAIHLAWSGGPPFMRGSLWWAASDG